MIAGNSPGSCLKVFGYSHPLEPLAEHVFWSWHRLLFHLNRMARQAVAELVKSGNVSLAAASDDSCAW